MHSELENIVFKSIDAVKDFFPYTVEEAREAAKICLARIAHQKKEMLALSPQERTYYNTVCAYDRLAKMGYGFSGGCEVMTLVSSEAPEYRAISVDFSSQLTDVLNDKEMYYAFCAYRDHAYVQEKEQLTAEQRYFFTQTMEEFMRDGFMLSDELFGQVTAVRKTIAQWGVKFTGAIDEKTPSIAVKESDLSGVNPDFVAAQKRDASGNVILFCDYPTYDAVAAHCTNANVREALWLMFARRGFPANQENLTGLINARMELARLIGYESYAALSLADKMVRSPANAHSFLQSLEAVSLIRAEEEMQEVVAYIPSDVVLTDEDLLKPWDAARATEAYRQARYAIDNRVIAEYFPLEVVFDGMLKEYAQFFGVVFEKHASVPGLWHEEVRGLTVFDAATGALIGHILLDLFPREGKYSHACCCDAFRRSVNDAGEQQPALAVLVTNFPRPLGDKPALMVFSEVKTLFHEFGHAMHALLSRPSLYSHAGCAVKLDFVELPSQILEEWVFEQKVIERISAHYQTGATLPGECLTALKALRDSEKGRFVARQLGYSWYSLVCYEAGGSDDLSGSFRKLMHAHQPGVMGDTRSESWANFGHLDGYGAGYYGYLYSRAYAWELFAEIKRRGISDPTTGRRYVECILAPGGSRDPMESLQEFLGRGPSLDSYIKYLAED